MRLWSLHPSYLDTKGLVAAWREALLAKKVLGGGTRGYINHPQLRRFRLCSDPQAAVNFYLQGLFAEARNRGYQFSETKLAAGTAPCVLPVNSGQLRYEFDHLLNKLAARDPARFLALRDTEQILPHPLFSVVPGGIEEWELLPEGIRGREAEQKSGRQSDLPSHDNT